MRNTNMLSVYRRSVDNMVVGIHDDGTVSEPGDWTAEEDRLIQAALRREGYRGTDDLKADELVYLTSVEDNDDLDGMGDAPDDIDPDESEQDGDGQGEADQGDAEGEGDDDDDDAEGEPDPGDDDAEGEPEYSESEGEQDSFDNPIADELWDLYYPRVVQIAEHRASSAYRAANGYTRAHSNGKGGGNGGGGITIRVSGKKVGELPGGEQYHYMFPKVLRVVARGLNVYLPGPPGTGKSHMAKQIADALGRQIHIDSFSPMSTESKLNGFVDAHGNVVETGYRRAFIGGWIYVGDELDNSNPAIVTGINSGLANGVHAFPDGTFEMHPDFQMIATANTLGMGATAEFAGRQKLDPATLNRFVKIPIGTDEAMEQVLVEAYLGDRQADRWLTQVRRLRRGVADLGIRHFVTMRDSLHGAKLIAPGDGSFSVEEALEMTILNVLTDDQKAKLKAWRG